ncbi:hypothetical protein [Dysgonomonas sp. HGC4]|uniref:hypothetical protein n=1 Tax=Dysgonomonas sp. HGC4 TaxID=1658009 RepID=UPI000680EC65|nr:hypothetical protein [Dysgonomonas sp. HGC4]MBD8346772.1 hypothetical protein [Dysgonomonas sp. HGC4]
MDDKIFFGYYFSALKQALEKDNVNHVFLVKDPSWYYPVDMSEILDKYEDKIYEKYLLLDRVYGYFDAKSHGFTNIKGVSLPTYRDLIISDMNTLAKLLNIDLDNL